MSSQNNIKKLLFLEAQQRSKEERVYESERGVREKMVKELPGDEKVYISDRHSLRSVISFFNAGISEARVCVSNLIEFTHKESDKEIKKILSFDVECVVVK
jgi:hypothetical protein